MVLMLYEISSGGEGLTKSRTGIAITSGRVSLNHAKCILHLFTHDLAKRITSKINRC